jgi:mercuric ion transport protein
MSVFKNQISMLVAGGVAAILASACCIGPLLLVSVGLGGAWVSNLHVLEPYKPLFLGVALIAMVLAYRKIFRPATDLKPGDCKPGQVCAMPKTRLVYKIIFGKVLALMLLTLTIPYFAHYFY